jgi:hypothetical protein
MRLRAAFENFPSFLEWTRMGRLRVAIAGAKKKRTSPLSPLKNAKRPRNEKRTNIFLTRKFSSRAHFPEGKYFRRKKIKTRASDSVTAV